MNKTTNKPKTKWARAKRREGIKAWNEVPAPSVLIDVLSQISAPRAVFVEVSIVIAEAVLPKFEAKLPKDTRPRRAIDTAKAWLKDGTVLNGDDLVGAVWASHSGRVLARDVSYAAWTAYYAACTAHAAADTKSNDAYAYDATVHYASTTVSHAIDAGLDCQRAMGIIKKIGHKHFKFLREASTNEQAKG
jgi:hypothetical protein